MKKTLIGGALVLSALVPTATVEAVGEPYTDRACMAALKAEKPWLSYSQREARCTVEGVLLYKDAPKFPAAWIAGTAPSDQGSSAIDVGTALWGFTLEVFYTKTWIPPQYNSWAWSVQSITCDRHGTFYLAMDLDPNDPNDCGKWWSGDTLWAGARYVISYTVPPITVTEPQYAAWAFKLGENVRYEQGRGHNP